jgi:hypothetical protein
MPSKCVDLDWNPIISAPLHSTFAGVLAGLVFAAIVVLLSARPTDGHHMNSVAIFGASFFTLAFDSFLFGVISGEQVCARAWTETMLAAGLLGLGVVGMFAGTCWLVDDGDPGPHATRLFLWITYFSAVIVGYHLAITASDYLRDLRIMEILEPQPWLTATVDVYKWAILGLVGLLFLGTSVVRRRHANPLGRPRRSVAVAGYSYIACVLGAAAMAGQAAAIPKGGWDSVDPVLIAASTLVSLALPAVALIVLLFALPSGRSTGPSPARDRVD